MSFLHFVDLHVLLHVVDKCILDIYNNSKTFFISDGGFSVLGLVYTYLAGHIGHSGNHGAFRALTCGYTHWASGRLQEMKVNVNHPAYCHVRCVMKPSMKQGVYCVYMLLGREGELATISSATCECAARYV